MSDPFARKGTLPKLVVGKTSAFDADKHVKDCYTFAFGLPGQGQFGYGHLLFTPNNAAGLLFTVGK